MAEVGTRIIVFSASSSAETAGPAAQPTSALSDETVEGDGAGWGVVICATAGEPMEPAIEARKVRPKSAVRMMRRCGRRGKKACPESRNSGRTAYHARMLDVKRGSRVGAIAAVLCYGALDLTLQGRYRLAPRGAVTAIGVLLIVLLIATYYVKNQRWRRIEWIAMRLCIVTSMILNAANLADVVQDVLFDSNTVEPTSLILTSLAIWSANVLVFSLLYWAIDRGGPDARASGSNDPADFDFPAYTSTRATARLAAGLYGLSVPRIHDRDGL